MKGALVSFAGFLFVVGCLLAYILTAPPIPFTETAGAVSQGDTSLPVQDIALFKGLEGKAEIVIQAGQNLGIGRFVGVTRGKPHRIEINVPLQFDIPADSPARVALGSVATPVAIFDKRQAIRRFPREDSRVFAYTKPGMWKTAMRITPEWVKIEIKPAVEGWVLGTDASIEEHPIAPQVSFQRARAIRRVPYEKESRVRWEGRVVTKTQEKTPGGEPRFMVNAQNLAEEGIVLELPEKEWLNLAETQYIALLDNEEVERIEVPLGFTQMGPPYEIVERDGNWLKIQLQDQGWVPKSSCLLDVHYRYTITRRQRVKQLLFRLFT